MDGAGGQPGDRRTQAARARGLPLRGGRRLARAADAPGRRAGSTTSSRSRAMRVITDELPSGDFTTEATVKVWVGDDRHVRTCRGQRPGQRHRHGAAPALGDAYPQLAGSTSPTSRCASSTAARATGAVTRVLLEPPTASATGPRSGSARTSSRRRGGRSRRASCTACCTRCCAEPVCGRPRSGLLRWPADGRAQVSSVRTP